MTTEKLEKLIRNLMVARSEAAEAMNRASAAETDARNACNDVQRAVARIDDAIKALSEEHPTNQPRP